MCGIAGQFHFDAGRPVDPSSIHAMCEAIKHRGPNDEGLRCEGPIGLGMRRLSIIDVQGGHQPIYNEDKTVWVVFNGEIYNFQEIRKCLEAKGHRFSTHTDTEVIVHLYEEKGEDCVQDLRGMFAFALWDSKKKQLLLARDRLGKKPLCYTMADHSLIFCSELNGLRAHPAVQPGIDPEAIHLFLTYQYIPSPKTIYQGVHKLPPATVLICDQSGRVRLKKYWELDHRKKLAITQEECSREIRERLLECTRLRMISDVPLGAFLSGGIDSSAVVGFMSQLSTQPVKTFSIGFEEQDFSELSYARLAAERFKTDHQELIVKADAARDLPKIVWHYGEPYADSSALPSFYLAQMTRRHVTVALNGDGGDETFAGYHRHRGMLLSDALAKLADLVPNALFQKLISLVPHGQDAPRLLRSGYRFLQPLQEPPERRNIRWHCFFDNEQKERLYSDDFRERFRSQDAFLYMAEVFRNAKAFTLLDKTLQTDILTYLPEDLLVKMDIATMAHSLETRSPFLDHTFVEFTAQIPSEWKIKGLDSKHILKKALQGFLPDEILNRRKMGFGIPLAQWFRKDLKDYVRDILLSPRALQRGYFRKESVEELLESHIQGRADHGYRLWALLVLELWHQVVWEKRPAVDSHR